MVGTEGTIKEEEPICGIFLSIGLSNTDCFGIVITNTEHKEVG